MIELKAVFSSLLQHLTNLLDLNISLPHTRLALIVANIYIGPAPPIVPRSQPNYSSMATLKAGGAADSIYQNVSGTEQRRIASRNILNTYDYFQNVKKIFNSFPHLVLMGRQQAPTHAPPR